MQQGVQTDATCNIQQCCVRLHGALESKYLIHCFLHVQVQEVMQEAITEDTTKSINVETKLLDWCKERLKG